MKRVLYFCLLLITLSVVVAGAAAGRQTPDGDDIPYQTHFDLVVDDERGRLYTSRHQTGEVEVWALDTLTVTEVISFSNVNTWGVDISPDGNQLAVALSGDEPQVALIDLDNPANIDYVPVSSPYDVIYGRSGRLYVATNSLSVEVIDTNIPAVIGNATHESGGKPNLGITADGNTLYLGLSGPDSAIYRLDVTTDTPVITAQTPEHPYLVRIAVDPDGSRVFTSRGQIWPGDLTGPPIQLTMSGDMIAYAPNLDRLYISDGYGLVTIDASTYVMVGREIVEVNEGALAIDKAGKNLYMSILPFQIVKRQINLVERTLLPLAMNEPCLTFNDSFGSPATGWPLINNSDVQMGYLDGEYRILSNKLAQRFIAVAPTCGRASYTVEVDARWNEAIGKGYGLMLGLSADGSSYYLLEIFPNQRSYSLAWFTPGNNGFIVPLYSAAIQPGTAVNHIKGIVTYDNPQETRIHLEINGVEVWETWQHDFPPPTRVGLFSSTDHNAAVSDARFDNFVVKPLP
jgi:hypothetical protein